jgi:hypothetical protein
MFDPRCVRVEYGEQRADRPSDDLYGRSIRVKVNVVRGERKGAAREDGPFPRVKRRRAYGWSIPGGQGVTENAVITSRLGGGLAVPGLCALKLSRKTSACSQAGLRPGCWLTFVSPVPEPRPLRLSAQIVYAVPSGPMSRGPPKAS